MEQEQPIVSPAVLQRELSGFMLVPSVVESANFEDYVERISTRRECNIY